MVTREVKSEKESQANKYHFRIKNRNNQPKSFATRMEGRFLVLHITFVLRLLNNNFVFSSPLAINVLLSCIIVFRFVILKQSLKYLPDILHN